MKTQKRLIWLCPKVKFAVGGVKVIYRQASIADQLLFAGGVGVSFVLHPAHPFYRINWMDSGAKVENRLFRPRLRSGRLSFDSVKNEFDKSLDTLVVPEWWAADYGAQLSALDIPYIIYVQNGYLINRGDPADLDAAYYGAKLLLSISDDASECIKMAFPGVEDKLVRMHYSLDHVPRPVLQKRNLITYMPRKLSDHSQKLIFLLRHRLPSDWSLCPVHGVSEVAAFQMLERSKVFLSFSSFEGCPLPPLEASLLGNYVIGYTGEGAKEYWGSELFKEVESGNLRQFADFIVDALGTMDFDRFNDEAGGLVDDLRAAYSSEVEVSNLKKVLGLLGNEV